MDDDIYTLLLTSGQGWSLVGSLRVRYLAEGAARLGGVIPAVGGEQLQPANLELAVAALEGSIAVPLLSGWRQVALNGIGYGTAAGLFSIVLGNTSGQPAVAVQLFPLPTPTDELAGSVVWDTGSFGELVLSVLATRLPRLA